MNKTVNINLAGTFFHIDEDAYLRLSRYLESIKRSFTDSQGRDEIVRDIEARIAELFTEKMQNDKTVISSKHVDDVIEIMGQPEDYLVDDDIFEDGPQQKSSSYRSESGPSKKLYRDTDKQYISGVSAGLGHYLGIDAIWVRILWVILAASTGGGIILIYILFWAIVPEAATTSEKLSMRGKPVNISNIERKIKEGFDDVSEKVKSVDYQSYGNKVKSSSQTFFDALASIFKFGFKVVGKFVGIILLIVGAAMLISLIVAFFGVGTFRFMDAPWMDYVELANIGAPLWVVSLLTIFAVGIPFFFILLLGLKLLISNLKSIGTPAKLILLGLWFVAVIILAVLGVRQGTERAYQGDISKTEELNFTARDTLYVQMNQKFNDVYSEYHYNDFSVEYDDNDNKVIYSNDVRVVVRSTDEPNASIRITKSAHGSSRRNARTHAEVINYGYAVENNKLILNTYLTAAYEEKFRDQEVDIVLYLPEGTHITFDRRFNRFSQSYRGIEYKRDYADYLLKVEKDTFDCQDCPEEIKNEDWEYKDNDWDQDQEGIKIDEDGVKIKKDNFDLEIDEDGLRMETKDSKLKIDEDGAQIKTDS
ncbi:PspC domain-containing protein [Spongiivirga citrea]|uniref:PspC domain-containing protein n=1 Tax=Spongiivirga citrea TaxID=1481457 RepID=A0A6M0CD03_9FLAO|nr:PspC domain-containing protein [Spongiivirga citrea]NER15718.1 PspC domain-containing protein [Spongiivirga citrea]